MKTLWPLLAYFHLSTPNRMDSFRSFKKGGVPAMFDRRFRSVTDQVSSLLDFADSSGFIFIKDREMVLEKLSKIVSEGNEHLHLISGIDYFDSQYEFTP